MFPVWRIDKNELRRLENIALSAATRRVGAYGVDIVARRSRLVHRLERQIFSNQPFFSNQPLVHAAQKVFRVLSRPLDHLGI